MSILIRNMDMPKNCISCRLRHSNDCLAILGNGQEEDGVLEYNNYRPSWCPLVEVKPHGRLIDADALHIDLIDRGIADIQTNDWHEIRQAVDDAPTIIESEKEE